MEIEEIREFLQQCPPFDQLTEPQIHQACSGISVSYHAGSTDVSSLSPENKHPQLLIIRTGDFKVTDNHHRLVNNLQPGDVFGYQQLLTGDPDDCQISCQEDGLIYRLNQDSFHQIRSMNRSFDQFFQHLFASQLHQQSEGPKSHLTRKVEDVITRNIIAVPSDHTIQQTAQIMAKHRVSSVIITSPSGCATEGDMVGIVTDRDLRTRVVAEAIDVQGSVDTIMTVEPICATPDQWLYEAVLSMTRHNIHHLPVVENQRPVGVITTTDIVRAQQDHPVYIIGDMQRQTSIDDVINSATQIRHAAEVLGEQEVRAHEASSIITTMTDALTERLIELAINELGDPPCKFVWLSFGSQARMEQSVNADQDNGLLIERPLHNQKEAEWFKQLAHRVCDGLNACGIRYCSGGIMATNDIWRQPLDSWQSYFAKWIKTPEPKALMHCSIFFDCRSIYGDHALFSQLQQYMLNLCVNNDLFLMHMAENALQHQPPLTFFNRFIVEKDGSRHKGMNMKTRGLTLITDLARVYALSVGASVINTTDRLEYLIQHQVIHKKDGENLLDAFEFISQLRWQYHSDQLQEGILPNDVSNLLDPASLSGLERHQLKDALAVAGKGQAGMKLSFCRSF